MPLAPATQLGPYEILSAIGAGGMGEVYRARDTRLERIVAIKVLPAHLSNNPQSRERFEREAKAISSLSHPHICPLYDVGHQDGITKLRRQERWTAALAQECGNKTARSSVTSARFCAHAAEGRRIYRRTLQTNRGSLSQ